ncbi:MAG TPA: hypothetical protein VGF22_23290, partial [Acidimicrobiales bacterium]
MTAIEQHYDQPVPTPTNGGVRWRLFGLGVIIAVLLAGTVAWALDASVVGRWLAVHTGTDDLSGPWYGFWSGFGSDL